MMKRVFYDNERGVALIFAIGVLALLLVLGLAFVSNAIITRKAAENNSARTQARMLANSAISRAAAGIMIYQHQYAVEFPEEKFPSNFDNVCSMGEIEAFGDTASSYQKKELQDGLISVKTPSLMQLPVDYSVVDPNIANLFNTRFINAEGVWPGQWVYFFNDCNPDSEERRIIGRAAWQVVSTDAQILAQVFLRGRLEGIDKADTLWTPDKHRWGREIDEVNLDRSDNMFGVFYDNYNGQDITDYTQLFQYLGSGDTAEQKKRWIERWLVPVPEVTDDNFEPVTIAPEAFVYTKGSRSYNLQRFNLGELDPEKMGEYVNGAGANCDPWYIRLGIDTGNSTNDSNSDKAVLALAGEALEYQYGDTYDYELTDSEDENTRVRSGLPFLRQIGNDTEKGSFPDVTALRKQITANLNDYCDMDGVPTSDVPAATWVNSMDNPAVTYTHPTYTGNERTPYLYELAMAVGMFREQPEQTGTHAKKSGIAAGVTGSASSYKLTMSTWFKAASWVKLANIYPFDPDDAYITDKPENQRCKYKNFQAEIDYGEISLQLQLDALTLTKLPVEVSYVDENGNTVKMNYETDIRVGTASQPLQTATVPACFTGLKDTVWLARASAGKMQPARVAFTDADVKNTSGVPHLYPAAGSNDTNNKSGNSWERSSEAITLAAWDTSSNTVKDAPSFSIPATIFTDSLPSACEITNSSLTAFVNANKNKSSFKIDITGSPGCFVHQVRVSKAQIQPRRMVLLADTPLYKGGTSQTAGVDYVRSFPKPVAAEMTTPMIWKFSDYSGGSEVAAGTPGVALGGIRNYDPRQNLNPDDWYPNNSTAGGDSVKGIASAVDLAGIDWKGVTNNGTVNSPRSDDISEETTGRFSPNYDDPDNRDTENVAVPVWTSDTSHLSTAFIRNAPMMSPWELGLIHRGIRWQTLNLKKACDPNDNGKRIQRSGLSNNPDWENKLGTKYSGGDGAILEEIKMTERCGCYGKINVNKLVTSYETYNAVYDPEIIRALFDNLRLGQDVMDFYRESQRGSDFTFNALKTGTAPKTGTVSTAVLADIAARMCVPDTSNRPFANRTQFLHWRSGGTYSLGNLFGTFTPAENDAAQEEIIGKTINLLTAASSTPSIVYMVIVAQSIKDVAGQQYRPVSADDGKTANYKTNFEVKDGMAGATCSYGKFDAYIHKDDSRKNVYFDEITGEVKMFVTFMRNVNTGQLKLLRIDYL